MSWRRPAAEGTAPGDIHRVVSWRWRRLAVPVVLGGAAITIAVEAAILAVDGTGDADHFTTVQDVVGTTAAVVAIVLLAATLWGCIRCVRRPALSLGTGGITIWNWRAVSLPWPMIATVATAPVRRWGRRRSLPAVRLVDGRQIVMWFAPPGPPDGPATEIVELVNRQLDTLGRSMAAPAPATWTRPLVTLAFLCRDLPDGAARRLPRQPVSQADRRQLSAAAVSFPLLSGLVGTDSGPVNVAQLLLRVGCGALIAASYALVTWSSATRELVLSSRWVATRARLQRRWRVALFDDLTLAEALFVPIQPPGRRRLLWSRRRNALPSAPAESPISELLLERGDGHAVHVRPAELRIGVARQLLRSLDRSPALSVAAGRELARIQNLEGEA